MRLGLIEAILSPAASIRVISGIRGVCASASLKPAIMAERLAREEMGIRGVCASASLKRGLALFEGQGGVRYPRRMRLGLIEATT